jgi:hypothetical protein
MTILAGVEICAAATDGGAPVLPGADDEVGVAVVVHVAGHRRAGAESLAGRVTRQREQATAVPARVHIDAAGGRPLRVVRPVRGVDVRNAVAIDVARHREEHRTERGAGFVGVDDEGRLRLQAGVHVRPARSGVPGLGRADDHVREAVVVDVAHS